MRLVLAIAALVLAPLASRAADLTATEMRWLQAGWPVVDYAKAKKLPLDIVVQPQAKAGDAPLAMGFVDDRCKLVLSMRGNPEAQTTLDALEPALLPAIVEAMFAHELGHCWRYVHGAWHTLPAGFVDVADDAGASGREELAKMLRDMRETRREEGYADLVGLAWTLSRHPGQYEQVQAWFEKVRADQPVAGAHHDTRVWVRLARERSVFAAGDTPFEQARGPWKKGLLE
ncbi:hypothetical protein [Piscinibacter sp. XHJ-5]|uniref:hypothetical protein n=1 Tax=Piscinibacter sp. XHJ-5 TaxID=3037797 RepID=UPI002452B6A9|nr:hypothetical protein [Piscinibacter sp. XHJ-5]